MKFDERPIPSNVDTVFTSRYMEAKVLEDIRLINEITENFSLGYLSEACALDMLVLIGQSEYTLLESAFETDDILNGKTLNEVLNVNIDNIEFFGEGVIPYKEIVKARENDSLFHAYTTERCWSGEGVVYNFASSICDEKEANLSLYKESKGTEGFTEFERNLYATYPDDRIDPAFLYEKVIDGCMLSGSVTLENGFIMKNFINSRFAVHEDVASMMPVIPLTGDDVDPDLSNTKTKDLVASTNSEAADNDKDPTVDENEHGSVLYGTIKVEESVGHILREAGAFIVMEGVVYKNNIVFDSEIKKIYDKISKHLKMSKPDNPAESFKKMINVKKNRYTFNFANEQTDSNEVEAAIISSGFRPIKENGTVVRYEKTTKGIKITVEFTSIDNGVISFYETAGEVVKESSLDEKIEFGITCDASDVKDAAKKVKKLKSDKNTDPDDMEKAVNALDHAIENYKDVQKAQKEERDVKESASSLLSSLREVRVKHDLFNEWVKESAVDGLPSEHPLFCKNSEYTHGYLTDIVATESKILTRESFDSFVTERVNKMVEMIVKENPADTVDVDLAGYFTSILTESPSVELYERCFTMLESVYNTDVNDEEFVEAVKFFNRILSLQKDNESICETVLNNVEFMEENFNESTDEIDSEIRDVIELLNRLGYKVKYSSAGHSKTRIKEDIHRDGVYHGKLYTTARITFDGKINLKSVPDGWYENKNSDKTAIYVRAFTYNPKDGTPNEAFEKWKKSYIKALKDWAENLDKVDDEPEVKTEAAVENFEKELASFTESIIENPSIDFDSFIETTMDEIEQGHRTLDDDFNSFNIQLLEKQISDIDKKIEDNSGNESMIKLLKTARDKYVKDLERYKK